MVANTPRAPRSAALAELERYKLLVDSVQDYAIFLLDAEGYVITWNAGAEKNKGYKAHEIIGKHFSNFYIEEDKAAEKPARELELAKKFGRVEDEDWRVRKDGSRFWANVVITALYNDAHDLVGFAKVTRDLTERKQHEDELRKANALLQQQQRDLRSLNSSKDEFISLASHQLRTPATSVKQHLGMILEGFLGPTDAVQLEFIKKAYESNEHQLAIVNGLLKVAQIDDGNVVLHKTASNVLALFERVTEEYSEWFNRRNQKVVLRVEDVSLCVNADVHYLRMALENLVDNASKYTPPEGVITLSATPVKDGTEIAISDTGVGMTAVDTQKLFSKFTRIPNELSDTVGGSGLGLYWVRRVISLHGGTISVESGVNEGTTFTVFLPVEGYTHA